MPFATSSFLLLVAMPGAPSSILVTTSKALVTSSDALLGQMTQCWTHRGAKSTGSSFKIFAARSVRRFPPQRFAY